MRNLKNKLIIALLLVYLSTSLCFGQFQPDKKRMKLVRINSSEASLQIAMDKNTLKRNNIAPNIMGISQYLEETTRIDDALKKEIPELVNKLGTKKSTIRNAAIKRLKSIGPKAAESIRLAAKDSDSEIQKHAKKVLASFSGSLNTLFDPNDPVVQNLPAEFLDMVASGGGQIASADISV